jgi:RNA polymerase sigma-70 factor (ECF subfamily)
MCFHASRFRARKNQSGELILYEDQNEDLWDSELIARGVYYLHQASDGNTVSKYHLEAAIAWWLTKKNDSSDKWQSVLNLYDQLLKIEHSPIAALNRIYALSKVKGKRQAIAEAQALSLANNPYYHALLGELHHDLDNEVARQEFAKAMALARTRANRD